MTAVQDYTDFVATVPVVVAPGLWRLTLPAPTFGNSTVQRVHAYLIQDDKLALVDCGFAACEQALVTALASIGHRLEDLDMILYTHPHGDHIGGPLTSDPRLGATRVGGTWTLPPMAVKDCLRGLPRYLGERLPSLSETLASPEVVDLFFMLTEDYPNVALDQQMADGDVIDLGTTRLEVVYTPGHAPDHVAFLDRARGHVFSGDLLADRGPAIVGLMGASVDHYLASLRRLAALPSDIRVFPAHGKPLPTLGEITQRSADRIQRLKDSLMSRLSSGWTELPNIFADVKGSPDTIVSSVAQTLTFLDWLVASGLVEHRTRSGTVQYRVLQDKLTLEESVAERI